MPRKRKNAESEEDDLATPRKAIKSTLDDVHHQSPSVAIETPTSRRSILKKTPGKANGTASVQATPNSLRKVLFSTPGNHHDDSVPDIETPTAVRNDRSALRKSRRALLAQTEEDNSDHDEQEDSIALAILDGEAEEDDGTEDEPSAPDTPSKVGRPRGRPKGRRRERTPSPPPDLPAHELYFFQNRAAANKTSSNTLPSHLLLGAEDYYAQIAVLKDHHASDLDRLGALHTRAFDQWMFELDEGFNLCLYGYGSKRSLLMEFANHMYSSAETPPKIVVINGYALGLTIKDVLSAVASAILPKSTKLPAQAPALLDLVLAALPEPPQSRRAVALFIHSLDHANLRKAGAQTALSRLAAHAAVALVASCDNPGFPLLWDHQLARQLRFLHHDATTFQPFRAELDAVEDVNLLLGRSRRSLGGKDGVGFVLRSLPEHARSLFRILVAEQLALADVEGDAVAGAPLDGIADAEDFLGVEDEEEAASMQQTPSRRGRGRPRKTEAAKKAPKMPKLVAPAPVGVEYRTLYHKAVEEFVCSSEVNFRTLLKEFHDHQMIESRRDAMGTERLVVPFRREELETILEELV